MRPIAIDGEPFMVFGGLQSPFSAASEFVGGDLAPPGEFPVPLFDVVANCLTIRGSFVGTRGDMAEALAFAAEGKIKADIELQPLSSINQIFDRLEHGDVPSRVVLEFAAS